MKLLGLLLFISTVASAQNESEKFKAQILSDQSISKQDVKNEIFSFDISPILTKTINTSVLGFIGTEFERIRMKFISVVKDQDHHEQYFVYGKNMVKENVCEFQGTLTITKAFYLNDQNSGSGKKGIVIGDYSLFENASQKHVGFFKGSFKISWYIDKQGQIQYDDLNNESDMFRNNEFVGTWTSYSGTINKPCHWGDYRIPMSGDLDNGTGDFSPNQKYINDGWIMYQTAWNGKKDLSSEQARAKEQSAWWK